MKIKGAIFDLDGTLLDSMFIWDTIGESYLLNRGITPRENLNETFKSMSLLQAAEYYQREYGLTDSTSVIMDGVNQMIEHFYMNEVTLKEGVQNFLLALKKKGVKMCVATATDKYLVEATLKRQNIYELFSAIFTCTEVGYGKDQPNIYNTALEHLGTKKEETFLFEDALYAIKTAKMADYKVVGIYDKSEEMNQTKIQELVDVYIQSFMEMGDYVD